MDQPTAEEALRRLDCLVGDWTIEATWPSGERWTGKASFEWMESRRHLLGKTSLEHPQAPDSVSVIGCDAANGTYYELYSDDRNVCRVVQMTIGDGRWVRWRQGEPFAQRFTGLFSADGNTITMHLEMAEDGTNFKPDFDMVYRRAN
jgi:hypothetical protein